MRLWIGEGGLMTDEQVLAYLAHFGSLRSAADKGDVRLVARDGDWVASRAAGESSRKRDLSSYLSETERSGLHE